MNRPAEIERAIVEPNPSPLRVGLIGCGAIGSTVQRLLTSESPKSVEVVGILARAGHRATNNPVVRLTASADEFLAFGPQLVVECAGHAALREHGVSVLRAGIDLMIVSTGALVDRDLEVALMDSARGARARIEIPGGAIGGIEMISVARRAGLSRVRHTTRKPPGAWRGTPAEAVIDLDSISEASLFFEGSARDATRAYPENANVSATISLAGLGFDRTETRLVADPGAVSNTHIIEASGEFGSLKYEISSHALSGNPKSSGFTAFSIAQSVLRRSATLKI